MFKLPDLCFKKKLIVILSNSIIAISNFDFYRDRFALLYYPESISNPSMIPFPLPPPAQITVANALAERIEKEKDSIVLGVSIILVTHSPYIVDQLNNLLYAYETIEKHPECEYKIRALTPFVLKPQDVISYIFEDNGFTKNTCIDSMNDGNFKINDEFFQDVEMKLVDEFLKIQEIKREHKN